MKNTAFKSSTIGIMTLLATAAISTQANADFYKEPTGKIALGNPTYGFEVGIEDQHETIEGEDFVRRDALRVQATVDFQLYENKRGSTFDLETKSGLIVGYYKGSKNNSDDEYGDVQEAFGGATGEVVGTYTYNTDKIDPFVGLSSDLEITTHQRLEWQVDALAGVRYELSGNKSIALRYQHTLAHGIEYYNQDRRHDQNDGHAIALIGTKDIRGGGAHQIKVEFEHFDKSAMKFHPGGSHGYEPDTDNLLVSYKRTY